MKSSGTMGCEQNRYTKEKIQLQTLIQLFKRMVVSIINIIKHKIHTVSIVGLCGIRNGVIILDFYKLYVW